jgi:hypothetical protein
MKDYVGWMHINFQEHKYETVGCQKGGGNKKEEIIISCTYDQILEKMRIIFRTSSKEHKQARANGRARTGLSLK